MKKIQKNNDRIGKSNINYHGNRMTIVEYNKWDDIVVEFENGYRKKTRYPEFKDGIVKSLYNKSVFGIGYLGEGKYEPNSYNKINNPYNYWRNILKRCYDKTSLANPKNWDYKNCKVDEKWHNFQNFCKWYYNNLYYVENEELEIDKDILIKNNKIYSENTCLLVPQRINKLFIKNSKSRGKYPIGVYYEEKSKKFRTGYRNNGKQIFLGYYNTIEETFQVYKQYKEKYVKQLAEEYKIKIDNKKFNKVYKVLYNYKIEIDD